MRGTFTLGSQNKPPAFLNTEQGGDEMEDSPFPSHEDDLDLEIHEQMANVHRHGYYKPNLLDDPKSVSVFELANRHKESSTWIEISRPNAEQRKSMVQQFPDEMFHLILDVQQCMFRAGEDNFVELLWSLYDYEQDKYLSEEYCARLTPNGFPVNGAVDSTMCMFKNLKKNEIEGSVYIIVKVVRWGDMKLEEDNKNKNNNTNKRSKPRYRRPFAVGVLSLQEQRSALLSSLVTGEPTKPMSDTQKIYCPIDANDFPKLHRMIIEEQVNQYKVPNHCIGIALEMALYAGGIENVANKFQSFDQLTFCDHLKPQIIDDPGRNLLFLTIKSAVIKPGFTKKKPMNIECRAELRDENLTAFRERIQIGKGPMAEKKTTFQSTVFYHSNEPTFEERITIHLPDNLQELESCHLFLSFAHCRSTAKKREDPICFTFLNVFEEKTRQIVSSGIDHELDMYKWKTSTNYTKDGNLTVYGGHKCTVSVQLCSSKYSSDSEIHKFLSWKQYPPEAMIACVRNLAKKPIDSIITIFREVLDALFGLLARNSHEKLSEICYEALVRILMDVMKPNHKKVITVLNSWIDEQFQYPDVWRTLLFHFLRSILWAGTPEAAREGGGNPVEAKQRMEKFRVLQNSMRGSKYLFQVIQKSYLFNPNAKVFKGMLNKVFNAIFRMMGLAKPKTIVALQSFTLQNFLDFIQCLPDHSSQDLVNIVMHFLKSIRAVDKVKNRKTAAIYKLVLIRNFLELEIIKRKDIINKALTGIIPIIREHIGNGEEEAIACAQIIKACTKFLRPPTASVVAPKYHGSGTRPPPPSSIMTGGDNVVVPEEIMESFVEITLKMFQVLDDVQNINVRELTQARALFDRRLKQETKTVDGDDYEVKEVYRDIFCTMCELARAVTTNEGKEYEWNVMHSRVDKVLEKMRERDPDEFQLTVQTVLKSASNILKKSLFPKEWVFMQFLEAELCLRSFTWFESILSRHYTEKFSKELWVPYIQIGMRFLSQETFDLENIPPEKANLILSVYGDWRFGATTQVRKVWACLQDVYHVLASELVGDAVDAGRSSVEEVVSLSVDMFYDMMWSEFQSEKKIRRVEHQTIDEVDHLTTRFYENQNALEGYRQFFKVRLRAKLEDDDMREIALEFLDETELLFDLLVSLKSYPKTSEYEDERSDAMFHLMAYLQNSGKDQMHLRYIYESGLMQKELKNFTEAGNCFLQYAELLDWSNKEMKAYGNRLLQETETRRRIGMLELAYGLFMQGDSWEKAISVSKQLIHVYEHVLYDLPKLADSLKRQEVMWRLVADHDRVFLSCYLVVYYGNFDASLKGKSFVYRSGVRSKLETVRDFTDRIKSKFPDAITKNTGNPVPEEYLDPNFDGQFIRITTLQPSSREELEGKPDKWAVGNRVNAPQRLVKYYRKNEIDTFFYTFVHKDKKKKGENEFRTIWVTKNFVVLPSVLPSTRRRIEVSSSTAVTITPFQNAINSLTEKNYHVAGVATTVEQDLQHNTADLSMQLNGIIDAAVMGGIEKYREAFFDGTYFGEFPEERELSADFKAALKEQLRVVQIGMECFDKYCPEDLKPLKEYLEGKFEQMKVDLQQFIEEE